MTQSITGNDRNDKAVASHRQQPAGGLPSVAAAGSAMSARSMMASATRPSLIRFVGVGKSFGKVNALTDINVAFHAGECVGIAGHNGAGKSTLMSILAGVYAPSVGHIEIEGQVAAHYDAPLARLAGVRCVFQELSLCGNLSVAENMCVTHPTLGGLRWRKRAATTIVEKLDDIFPDHGLNPETRVSDLTLTQRQMVEIARAFTQLDGQTKPHRHSASGRDAAPVRVMILDEPTSSLDAHTASQLLRYVRRAVEGGMTCLLVTHMLGEIEQVADRVMVMRDGKLVRVLPRESISRDAIIVAMGQQVVQTAQESAIFQDKSGQPHVVSDPHGAMPDRAIRSARLGREGRFVWDVRRGGRRQAPLRIEVGEGEVVGFGGLAGQGQTEALLAIYELARGGPAPGRAEVAFVAGDRPRDGVFPVWSIAQNLDIRWLSGGSASASPPLSASNSPLTSSSTSTSSSGGQAAGRSAVDVARKKGLPGMIDFAAANAIVETWRVRIGIRGAAMHAGILSLSGGNQQKVLFARALASNARLILMDDPTRGVDVGTKRDIYQLVRDEAAKGRTFIWYTTENDELAYCDRTFVFRAGQVNCVLDAADCTEEALLAASFAEQVS